MQTRKPLFFVDCLSDFRVSRMAAASALTLLAEAANMARTGVERVLTPVKDAAVGSATFVVDAANAVTQVLSKPRYLFPSPASFPPRRMLLVPVIVACD